MVEGFGGLEFIPTVLSIVVVLVVLGATLLALRWVSSLRFGGSGRERRGVKLVDIVERHVIGRSGAILVMRYGGREYVVGVTESSITPLTEGVIDLRVDGAAGHGKAVDGVAADGGQVKAAASKLERLRDLTTRR